MVNYKKSTLAIVAMVALSHSLLADVTYTGADETSPLDLSLATNWSAEPTADDVATVSMSVASGAAFTLSGDLSVKGLSFTSVSAAISLAGPGRLTLGSSGITINAGKSFTLTAPVTTTAAQTWDFTTSAGIFTCGAKITGTENLTWTAYSITVSEPPGYGGRLIVTSKNAWDSYFKITKKGLIAASASLNGHFYPTFSDTYSPSDLVGDGVLILDGWNHPYFNESSNLNVGPGEVVKHGGDLGQVIKGTVNQTGGDVTLSGRIMLGRPFWGGTSTSSATYNLSDGLLQSVTTRTETTSLIIGYRNKSGKAVVKFNQSGGTVKMRNGVYVGGYGGTSTTIDEYNLSGGLFVPVRPNSDDVNAYCKLERHGLIFAGKGKFGTSGGSDILESTTSVGVFNQTGGTSDVTRVRWGYVRDTYDAGSAFASNCEGFGLFSMSGGLFKLGADGFCVHTNTWNQDADGETVMPHDSTYRIRLNGGTLQPQAAIVNKLQWEIEPSEDANGFTVDASKGDVDIVAPVWGSGKLRKTGAGTMCIADASRFTGTLAVNEGVVDVLPKYVDVWEDSSVLTFTADDVATALGPDAESGATVETWTDQSGEVVAGQPQKVSADRILPPLKPTLALNAFGTHAGIKFRQSGFEVPAAKNPVAGSKQWTAVVVFKDSAGGVGDSDRSSYEWGYGRIIMGNALSGEWQNNEWGICYPEKAGGYSNTIVAGMGWLYKAYTHATVPRGGLNDGKVHVAIMTQNDTCYSINVDGGFASNRVESIHQNAKTSARLVKPLWIGFGQQLTSGSYDGCCFQGTIAEIRFYTNRVLKVSEQNGLARALRAKYGVDQMTQTHELARLNANAGGAEGAFGSSAVVPAMPEGGNRWSADDVALDDGAAVETWTSDTKIEATKATGAGNAAPTLVKNALNGKAVLRFVGENRTVLGVAAADSPISGKYAATAAVVFRTTTDGTDENQSRYGRGLVSTMKGTSTAEDFSISLEKEGSIYGLYGSVASSGVSTWTRKPCRLADGTPHIVILSGDQEADTLVQMTDGLACRKTGLTTPTARGDYVLHFGGSATGATNAKCFTGDIAEIIVWDRGLTEEEMTAATENLAAKYKIRSLAKMPFEEGDVTDSGLSATNITVAAEATLRLPASMTAPLTLTGASISGEGRVCGSVRFAANTKLDFSKIPQIEDVQVVESATIVLDDSVLSGPIDASCVTKISGAVSVDVAAIDARLPVTKALPVLSVAEAAVADATFEVINAADKSMTVEYDAASGCLVLRRRLGTVLLVK